MRNMSRHPSACHHRFECTVQTGVWDDGGDELDVVPAPTSAWEV